MIEIDIPSIDPIQHKPKIFLGMTSRQILCLVPGVALGAALFMLTYKMSLDIAVIAVGVAVIPSVCMGWLTPYNIKFEDYVKLVYFNNFVANQKRIYKSDNEEEMKLLTIKERQELEKKQKVQELERKKKAKSLENKNKNKMKEDL